MSLKSTHGKAGGTRQQTTQAARQARSAPAPGKLASPARAAAQSTQLLIVDRIKAAIREGRLAPGQRLPELDLMAELNVGRGSIREALRMLAAEGIIELELHRGARIRMFTRDEVWWLHQLREVLEGLAASLAAGQPDKSDLRAALVAINEASGEAVRNGRREDYLKLNERFHDLIMRMSGNPSIAQHVERALVSQFRLHGFRFLTQQEMARSNEEHRLITDAILRGDAAKAEKAMREHIQSTRGLIMKVPDQYFSASATSLTELKPVRTPKKKTVR